MPQRLQYEFREKTDIGRPVDMDAEFRALEQEFSVEERRAILPDLFEEIFNPSLTGMKADPNIRRLHAKKGGEYRHFLLPGIPGGNGDINQIREAYGTRGEYFCSPEHVFFRIGQGEMWIIPRSANPHFRIQMSECSAIVGFTEDELVVAHISYSAIDEIEAVLETMENMGIDRKSIYVTASVGEYQQQRSDEEYVKRATSVQFYTDLGIQEDNIYPFAYAPSGKTHEGDSTSYNLAQVIGNKDELHMYTFDLAKDHHGSYIETRIGDFRNTTTYAL